MENLSLRETLVAHGIPVPPRSDKSPSNAELDSVRDFVQISLVDGPDCGQRLEPSIPSRAQGSSDLPLPPERRHAAFMSTPAGVGCHSSEDLVWDTREGGAADDINLEAFDFVMR